MSNPFPQAEGWVFYIFSDSHRRAANWNLARRAGGQAVTNLVCGRFCPDPLGIVLWYDKLEFEEVSTRPEQHCHSEPVRTTFVGISIEFRGQERHTP